MFEDEEETLPSSFEIYFSEALNLYKNAEYAKAIELYTTALELRPEDCDAFVARSKCYLKIGDPENALKDAESSLAEDKNFHRGLLAKAETLYYMGDFEMALVYFHRGHTVRPELNEFFLGIQKAQEAIDNAVGTPDKVKLTTKGDLTFMTKQTEKKYKSKAISMAKKSEEKQQIPKRVEIVNKRQEVAMKQLLGRLYGDREYLDKLSKEIDPKTPCGKHVSGLCEEGIIYLDTRSEFWRQHKPIYSRKHDKKKMLGIHAPVDPRSTMRPNEYLLDELDKIDRAQTANRHEDSLERAMRFMHTIEKYPVGVIDNKDELLSNLHSLMGNAYLELGQYNKALQQHKRDHEIGTECDLPESISRSLDNMGRVYARTGRFELAIETWTKKLPMCKSDLESTWLHHEIGRCHLELGNGEEAKTNGELSLYAADAANDQEWQLQASVLIAQAELKLVEHQMAVMWFNKALTIADALGDDSSKAAIMLAIEEVNKKVIDALQTQTNETTDQIQINTPATTPTDRPRESPTQEEDTVKTPSIGDEVERNEGAGRKVGFDNPGDDENNEDDEDEKDYKDDSDASEASTKQPIIVETPSELNAREAQETLDKELNNAVDL